MFKDKCIKIFIENHVEDFVNHNYAELGEFLGGIEGIKKTISRINKLSNEDRSYVLSTIIDYKRYNFDEESVDLILNHKLDLIKKFGSCEDCPNLDRIHYALQPNVILYKKLVAELWEKDNDEKDSTLVNYSSVLTKYYNKFHNMLDTNSSSISLKRQLLYLKPDHLEILLAFDNEYSTKENKKKLFNYLTKNSHLREDINSLNSGDFHELLMYVFSEPKDIDTTTDDYIDSKLGVIPEIISHMDCSKEYKLDRRLLRNLEGVPFSFLEKLSDKESQTSLENYKFVEVIDKYKEPEIIDMAIKRLENFQSKKNAGMFVDFITDDFFINSDIDRQKTLLNLFPEETIKMDIDEDLKIVIPDSSSVKESLSSSETLEFINPETKMKIIIKNKNK